MQNRVTQHSSALPGFERQTRAAPGSQRPSTKKYAADAAPFLVRKKVPAKTADSQYSQGAND